MHTAHKPACTYCGSHNTLFRKKAEQWECRDCEQRFAEKSPDNLRHHLPEKAAKPLAIFFSYGHDSNRDLVDCLRNDLERRGHQVWIDYKQIGIWEDWRGRITEGIIGSDLVIAFLSKHSMRDPGVCRNELAIALNCHAGMVYPILLEPLEQVGPPVTITHLQWFDLHDWRQIRDDEKPKVDWKGWYEDKFNKLIDVLENEGAHFHGDLEALWHVLQPLTFSGDIARHIPDFVGREWLFADYEHWQAHRTGSRLFWIKAGPGAGKTAVAAMLAHTRQDTVVGAWFVSSNSTERSNPARALRSLAYQIAARWPDYRRKLMFQLGFNDRTGVADWDDLRKSIETRNVDDLFFQLFAEPLQGLIWRESRLVILMDGLDEGTDQDGNNRLTDLISTYFMTLPGWLAFVVTSRPETPVLNRLAGFIPYEIDANDDRNRQDLRCYLDRRLSQLEQLATWTEHELDRVKTTLVDRSEGMILYLEQVLQGVKNGAIEPDRIDQIPKGLGSLYFIQFSHRFNSRMANYDNNLKPLLRLALASPGTLPEKLTCAALTWDTEHYRQQRIQLGAFLHDSPEGIGLFHKSLAEWLCSPESSPFYVDREIGSKQLGNFLWKHFEESNYDFAYSGPFADQLYDWLPHLVDHADIDVSVDLLIDRFLEKLSANQGLDAISAFVLARKSVHLAKSIMVSTTRRSRDWNPTDRLKRLDAAATRDLFSNDFNVFEYGLLRYLCENKKIDPAELAHIRMLVHESCVTEPYYAYLLEGPFEAIADTLTSACNCLEQGILAAHDDGRVTSLNSLYNDYRKALLVECGINFNVIATRMNALAEKIKAQGDSGDWAGKLMTLKEIVETEVASSARATPSSNHTP